MNELNCKTEGWAPLGQASKYLFNEDIIKAIISDQILEACGIDVSETNNSKKINNLL